MAALMREQRTDAARIARSAMLANENAAATGIANGVIETVRVDWKTIICAIESGKVICADPVGEIIAAWMARP